MHFKATVAVAVLILSGVSSRAADTEPGKARPAGPRTITTTEQLSYPPLFLTSANTLDPLDLARESWKGWVSKRGIPWGMMPDGRPTLRLPFDCRALPWPSIKVHSVDGPDNNMRTLGALALLHAMLVDEFKNDPSESGIIGYLQWCTDPLSGIPYSPDSMSRSCAIGHGEFAKNLVLMYRYTGQPEWHEWAQRALKTLRYYAVITNEPGLGELATYRQGAFTPGQLPSQNSAELTLGGWMHLALGWNLWAYAEWYQQTGDQAALQFATALGNRLCHGEDPSGNDGCLRPDGSFGGNSEQAVASWHMHGHTHGLPGLSLLGEQLLRSGQRDSGLKFLRQASRTFDWLYDPSVNPDAGSMTGWLGEWLMVATKWPRKADCEGCTVGDVVQTACALAAASRLDRSLADNIRYYDQAEQIFSGQLVEQRFRLTPRYLQVVRENIAKRVERESTGNVTWRDQSQQGNDLRMKKGNVLHTTGDFPKGRFPVVRFSGDEHNSLFASNSAALRLKEFSIFAVAKPVTGREAQTIFANYDNPVSWGKGINFQVNPDRKIQFFTADGTQANYDPMVSDSPLSEGYHVISVTYNGVKKEIWADGKNIGNAAGKPVDFGTASVASVGSLREFGFQFNGDIAEIIVCDSANPERRASVESYLAGKYGIQIPTPIREAKVDSSVFWVEADDGFSRKVPWESPEAKVREVESRYQEAVKTAERMVGQQMGACGFPDWANETPSDLDGSMPGLHMQGCCADATIRGAHAIWAETVTGDGTETRVNLAFNHKSSLLDVVSCLPHRGELNVMVKGTKKVLVRIPEWATKDGVKAYRAKKSVPVKWEGSYVVFDKARKEEQLTVTYPLRVAEVKETVGSLDGTEYTERWRGNTIVDISPGGKWIPMFQRPELDNERLPE